MSAKSLNWKFVTAALLACAIVVFCLWISGVFRPPMTADRAEIADAFRKLADCIRTSNHTGYFALSLPSVHSRAGHMEDYIDESLIHADINPDVDPRGAITFEGGLAYVHSTVRLHGGTPQRITMEFKQYDGHWLYTGNQVVAAPWKIPSWRSIWRHVTQWI